VKVTKELNRDEQQNKKNSIMTLFLLASFGIYCVALYTLTGGLCVFRGLLGIPCPGCGGSRAILYLAKGNLQKCLELNPSAPLVFLCLLNEIRVSYFKRGNKKLASILLSVSIIISLILYIVRMKLYFPYREPYVVYPDSLLIRILKGK
jgi:hypothetical protein